MAGLTGALAFGVTTWFLDQVAGVAIAPREPPSAMPKVALMSNFVAGVAAAAVAMAALTADRRALRRGRSQSPSAGASQVAS